MLTLTNGTAAGSGTYGSTWIDANGALYTISNASSRAYRISLPDGAAVLLSSVAGNSSNTDGANCSTAKFSQLITGNVFNDANGLTDNTVNGTGTNGGTNPLTSPLFAVLYDNTTGAVMAVDTVYPGGKFAFAGRPGNDFTVYLTTTPPTLYGASIPTITMPSGWVATGEHLGTGTGSDGAVNSVLPLGIVNADLTEANFGIEQPPTADPKTQTIAQPTGRSITAGSVTTVVSGRDADDGTLGNGNTVVITTLPSGTTQMFYQGNPVVLNQPITNFNPSQLSFTTIPTGATSVVFGYTFQDAAGKAGTSANYTVNWGTPLPVKLESLSGVAVQCNIQLAWTTSEERSFYGFNVQRGDGKSFVTIGTVLSKGSVKGSEYNFTSRAEKGRDIYRLELMDMNGSKTYSKHLPLEATDCSASVITMFPNPTQDVVTVRGMEANDVVMIYNYHGQLVASAKATGSQFIINMREYAAGLYEVIIHRNGQVVKKESISKR